MSKQGGLEHVLTKKVKGQVLHVCTCSAGGELIVYNDVTEFSSTVGIIFLFPIYNMEHVFFPFFS